MRDSETTDAEKAETTGDAEAGGSWDPAAANAWEEALIADLRANGGRPSGGGSSAGRRRG